MNRLILALIALSFVSLSAGCGQSGPLYVPGNPSKISHPPPPDDEAEEGEEETDTDKK